MTNKFLKSFCSISLVLPLLVLALVPSAGLARTLPPSGPSCFDYYKFQSVEIDLHGEKQIYKAGEGAKFVGFLTNKNGYPLVNGSLILRVSKFDPRSQAGNDIVAEWTAKDNINLRAGEKQFVSVPYQLPSGLSTGAYALTSYFLTQNKFNISGLSFTDDIYGGYATFTAEGKGEKTLKFDRRGVKADGEPYRIFGFLPKVFPENAKSIAVSVPLKNETNESLKTSLAYSLYAWDGADRQNLLKSWHQTQTLPASSSKSLEFNIDTSDRPVYFLKIKARAGDRESEIHLRFVKSGFRPRLNDVGLTAFPLAAGKPAVVFACYHNTTSDAGNGKLDVKLRTPGGREIASASFSGKITGDISVLSKEIKASDLDKAVLSAKLYDDKGNLVDRAEIPYDCSKFSEPICFKSNVNFYTLLAGIIIVIIALYFLARYFRKDKTPEL